MRALTKSPAIGEFTQGSIFNCLGSGNGYSEFGLVVTARCDIAQKKVSTVLCLPIKKMHDWINEVCRAEVLERSQKSLNSEINEILKSNKIPLNSIKIYGFDETLRVLQLKGAKKKDMDRLGEIKSTFDEGVLNPGLKVVKTNYNTIIDDLICNKKARFHFLERIIENEEPSGYVVDFASPICIPFEIISQVSFGLEAVRLRRIYSNFSGLFDFSEFDQVEVVSILNSPYIEHLMQRFTGFYSRIGTDDIAENDYMELKEKHEIR